MNPIGNRKVMQFGLAALIASLTLLVACGGGGAGGAAISSPPPAPAPGGSASTVALVNVGDSPADRVVAFSLTMKSFSLTRNDNSTVNLLSTDRRVEVTHVSGSAEPLLLSSIPQGTYTSASMVVGAPDVVYIDNAGQEVEKRDDALRATLNVAFNPPLVVGSKPPVLTIDVDARGSISIDPVSGNVRVTPAATVQKAEIPDAGHENEQEVENGEFEHVVGQVSAVSGNTFTITRGQSAMAITFSTNSSTNFEGAAGISGLPLNAMVRVEARTQQDGSILATEVELISPVGAEVEGLVTSTTGNPVTSFEVVVQDGNGMASTTSAGSVLTVNVDNRTRFRVETGKIDLNGLNLPAFSAATLSKGQRVEAESDAAPASGAITAESVKLQPQALVGAVSGVMGSQFTLTVADDSAFKLLTGKNTLTVFTQRNTKMKNNVSLSPGSIVKVRGLVLLDPAQNAFDMVAGRITTP